MTATQLCGAPHHRHPDTLCTEPAGHYRRDVDPHAGPLILDGRMCGGAAWDEPKEQHVTDRIPLDHLTSDALDALYDRIATLESVAAGNKRHVQLIVPDLERAEAALARVRALADRWDNALGIDKTYARTLRAALDEPGPAEPAAVAEAAIARVRDLHQPMQRGPFTICAHCSGWDGRRCLGVVTNHPCPTRAALDEPEPVAGGCSAPGPRTEPNNHSPA